MAKGSIFSTMDLLWGFFQARLRERDPLHRLLNARWALRILVAPMGLASSPSAFNRFMQTVCADQRDFCRVYFDDLFVFTESDSMDEHLAALDRSSLAVKTNSCTLSWPNARFCATEFPCLGDFIGRDGVRMDPDKIHTNREWPTPRTKRELQSFLGTCFYVLKYCSDFAELSAPLIEATRGEAKHEVIALDAHQLQCSEQLKLRLLSPPVLSHPDSSRPFHVKMDTSDYAIGEYLLRRQELN